MFTVLHTSNTTSITYNKAVGIEDDEPLSNMSHLKRNKMIKYKRHQVRESNGAVWNDIMKNEEFTKNHNVGEA